MKRIDHLLIGAVVGVVQYLLVTGTSYLAVKVNEGALALGLCCIVVVAVTMLNIMYKTTSISDMLLRIVFSVVSYFLVMLVCAYSGIIIKVEEILVIGNNGQLLQGLGVVFLDISSIVASTFAVVFKCIVLYCRRRKGKQGRQGDGLREP